MTVVNKYYTYNRLKYIGRKFYTLNSVFVKRFKGNHEQEKTCGNGKESKTYGHPLPPSLLARQSLRSILTSGKPSK